LNRITGFSSDQFGGHVETNFSIALPLRAGLAEEEIRYQAKGKISAGSLQKLLLDYGVQAAEMDIQLDQSKLQLAGPLQFSGMPLTLDWSTSFTGPEKGYSDFTVDAPNISGAQISNLGYDVSDYIRGNLALEAKARLEPGGVVTGTVNSVLNKTEISIPQLQWRKASGEDGSIDFTLHAEKGHFQAKDINAILGSLKTNENAELELTGSQLSLLLKHITMGSSFFKDLQLERSETGHLKLVVDGGELNLESFLPGNDQQSDTQSKQLVSKTEFAVSELESSKIVFELGKSRLDRVYLNKDTYFDNIKFYARRDTEGWQEFSLTGHNPFATKDASNNQPVATGNLQSGQFKAAFGPSASGLYPLNIEFENLGLLISAVKGRTIMQGGHLVLSGESAGPLLTQPVNATIEVDNFTVKEAPGISQVLNMASLTQLVSSLKNTGLAFNSLSGDLKLDGTHLTSKLLHAKGGSLALKGNGSADLKLGTVDFSGTVIPFSNVNSVVGMIPILGKAVVGKDGHGLMAIEYTIKGDFNNPKVAVKKESATPDLLEDVLDVDKDVKEIGSK
jgi:hypothetical protein